MAHEYSETYQDKDGKWSNHATSKQHKDHSRKLPTKGKTSYDTADQAVAAAIARSNRSNFGHGNNTIWESEKEEYGPTSQRRTGGRK
jgi:deoxyribodipyrimidine photolyase-like uncharacterized protein